MKTADDIVITIDKTNPLANNTLPMVVENLLNRARSLAPEENPLYGIRDSLQVIVTLLSNQVTKASPPVDGWMNCDEVADYLHLTRRAVRDGAANGNLPAHKYPVGSRRGVWRFKRDELDSLLAKKSKERQIKKVSVWQ